MDSSSSSGLPSKKPPTHGAHGGALAGKQLGGGAPPPPSKTYVVHILSAADLVDEDWVSGLSDPYCRLTFAAPSPPAGGDQAGRTPLAETRTIHNSQDPFFDEALVVDVPSSSTLYAELWDADTMKADDFLGECVLMADGAVLADGAAPMKLSGKKRSTLSASVAPHALGELAGRAAVVQARTATHATLSLGGVLEWVAAAGQTKYMSQLPPPAPKSSHHPPPGQMLQYVQNATTVPAEAGDASLIFALNGQRISIPAFDVDPTMTLNDYIRTKTTFTGTKKSCGKGF
eukprot:COSAG01_NODE_9404_length_2454_cov_38.859023_1_plen_288_part_00